MVTLSSDLHNSLKMHRDLKVAREKKRLNKMRENVLKSTTCIIIKENVGVIRKEDINKE